MINRAIGRLGKWQDTSTIPVDNASELHLPATKIVLERKTILDIDAFSVVRNSVTVVIGPNGAGKTTLLRRLLAATPENSPVVSFGDLEHTPKPLASLAPSVRARLIGYLPQIRSFEWPVTVEEIVALGRFAHGISLDRHNQKDRSAIEHAIAECKLEALAKRRVDTLSGGEAARVHCARLLAAQTPFVIADEPVNSLDPKHQLATLALFRRLATQGAGVVLVLHDLDFAVRYADRLVWMKEGRIVETGTVSKTLTHERLREIFDIEAEILNHDTDYPSIRPLHPSGSTQTFEPATFKV